MVLGSRTQLLLYKSSDINMSVQFISVLLSLFLQYVTSVYSFLLLKYAVFMSVLKHLFCIDFSLTKSSIIPKYF